MIRLSPAGKTALWFLLLLPVFSTRGRAETATVHIRLVDAAGNDIGEAKVEKFQSQTHKRNFATNFHKNSASDIPYGVYQVRAYATGYWTAQREVRVFQPVVWVVMQLELGMGRTEGGLPTFELSGRVKRIASKDEPVWLRLTGVYSSVSIDAKAHQLGTFTIAGIPQGLYVLTTLQGKRVLDVRPIQIPVQEPVVVDLRPGDREKR